MKNTVTGKIKKENIFPNWNLLEGTIDRICWLSGELRKEQENLDKIGLGLKIHISIR